VTPSQSATGAATATTSAAGPPVAQGTTAPTAADAKLAYTAAGTDLSALGIGSAALLALGTGLLIWSKRRSGKHA
jgi:hypothetical protein